MNDTCELELKLCSSSVFRCFQQVSVSILICLRLNLLTVHKISGDFP